MVFEIIPLLPVNEPCTWCDEQQCYIASVWYGDVLLEFFSRRANDLRPSNMNREACGMLRAFTKGIMPDAEYVVTPNELFELVDGATIAMYWIDFRPACLDNDAYTHIVCIKPFSPENN